jgi:hypothetical protein
VAKLEGRQFDFLKVSQFAVSGPFSRWILKAVDDLDRFVAEVNALARRIVDGTGSPSEEGLWALTMSDVGMLSHSPV